MILRKRIPFTYIIKSNYIDFIIVTLFTAITTYIHLHIEFFTLPMSISTVMGTAISLILSFNLSQSYDRWWEARKIWGEIVNDSRALILQLQSFTDEHEQKTVKKISELQIVWVNTVVALLKKGSLDKRIENYLSNDEQQLLNNAQHKPLAMGRLIQQHIKSLEALNAYQQVQIDSTLVRLVAHLGKAERIKNTVFPKEYQVVLHISIYLFLGFLSISLANLGHHWEILLLIAISAPFFLLETTATHLQDPFDNSPTDVPIASITRNIEINLLEINGINERPEPLADHGFYIN